MAFFYQKESRTFNEYLLVPGYSSSENIAANVPLKTPLVNVEFYNQIVFRETKAAGQKSKKK